MNNLIEILKYTVPMLILGAVFYYLIEQFFSEKTKQLEYELKKKDRDLFLPQKLQAYERMAIFIERIRPTHLVRRIPLSDNTDMFELAFVNAIQEEFDHNISQQIYIEPETWKIIFSAKNTTQNYFKNIREKLTDKNDTKAYQNAIIQNSMNASIPLNGAILKLQKDIQSISQV